MSEIAQYILGVIVIPAVIAAVIALPSRCVRCVSAACSPRRASHAR